jgi:peptide/nickel transport system substrate-binding protein
MWTLGWKRRLAGRIGVVVLLCVALAGCGSGSDPERSGTLRGTYSSFPEYLDPALNFSLEGATALADTYLPLLTYEHADGRAGTELIPGLAEALPTIDRGGRRYTLRLRPGLEYSDGTPVRASDFRSAVERLIRLNSAGTPFYMNIVGAERFAETKKGGIAGIETDDGSGRIVIRLREPDGSFSYVLALMYGALLPADTPAEDQTADPPPATGPYVVSKVKPGRSWEYERNPAWAEANGEAMPQLPDGHMDRIEFEVRSNPTTQVDEVERGQVDWMKNPPSPDRYPEIKRKYEGTQFREEPTVSVYYFWMNNRRPPFDDVRVRRAVNYAIDPEALERIYAGTIDRTQQVLPAQMPGYRKIELYPHDMRKAKKLMVEADPDDRQVTVWTNNLPPNDEAGEYYQQVLEDLGFEVKLKAVNAATYFTLIGNAGTPDLDTGWSNWFLDYPHPDDYFAPQLSGESILPNGNTNWANFDDPAIDAEIKDLGRRQLTPEVEREYGDLDEAVMKQAPWAPFGSLTLGTFVAEDVDLDELIVSPIFGQDLTSFQFK